MGCAAKKIRPEPIGSDLSIRPEQSGIPDDSFQQCRDFPRIFPCFFHLGRIPQTAAKPLEESQTPAEKRAEMDLISKFLLQFIKEAFLFGVIFFVQGVLKLFELCQAVPTDVFGHLHHNVDVLVPPATAV